MENDKKSIKIGDTVGVHFHGAQMTLCNEARVIYKPCATGDSWVFEDLRTKEIHHISEGVSLTKKRK